MLRVRPLSDEEGQALSRLVKRSNDPTVARRAMIVLHAFLGFSPPKIAGRVLWSEDRVRRVIKDYNWVGRDALYPKKARGPSRDSPLRSARRSSPSPALDRRTTVGRVPPAGLSTFSENRRTERAPQLARVLRITIVAIVTNASSSTCSWPTSES